MRLFTSLIVSVATVLVAGAASAALTVSSPQSGGIVVSPGDTVTIDITVETTAAEALALGLRAADYDNTILTSGTTTVLPASIFNFSPEAPFGGIGNVADGLEQAPSSNRPGWSINLFQGVSTSAAAGAGPDSFQITFVAGAEGTTTVNIGAFGDYADTYLGGDNGLTNTSVTVTVPEPSAVAGSLAALGSVLGVVAIRRRKG